MTTLFEGPAAIAAPIDDSFGPANCLSEERLHRYKVEESFDSPAVRPWASKYRLDSLTQDDSSRCNPTHRQAWEQKFNGRSKLKFMSKRTQ